MKKIPVWIRKTDHLHRTWVRKNPAKCVALRVTRTKKHTEVRFESRRTHMVEPPETLSLRGFLFGGVPGIAPVWGRKRVRVWVRSNPVCHISAEETMIHRIGMPHQSFQKRLGHVVLYDADECMPEFMEAGA